MVDRDGDVKKHGISLGSGLPGECKTLLLPLVLNFFGVR